jgi:DNA helicase II / ATP-dependent DNA helicase PcrA
MEKKSIKNLNITSEQQKAINEINGLICLSAGPGSGKTFVLVERYINILKTLVDSGININDAIASIIALTFTNKAANEMQARVKKSLIGFNDCNKILNDKDVDCLMQFANISTIDSWAVKILRDNALNLELDPEFSILDGIKSRIIFLDLAKKYFEEKNLEDIDLEINLDNFLHEIFNFIGYLKCRLIDPETFYSVCLKSKKEKIISEIIKDLYLGYESVLKENSFMDFNSILLNLYKMCLNQKDVLENISKNIKYLLVDEYQDINNAQDMVLRLISSQTSIKDEKENFFLVGDIGQSIYGFRNADYHNMLRYKQDKSFLNLSLSINFRSKSNIIEFVNKFFDNNYFQKLSYLETLDTSSLHKIEICCLNNIDEESRFIALRIKDLLNEGYKPKDIKILFRSLTNSVWSYALALDSLNIPFVVIGSSSLDKRPEIRDFYSMFKILLDPFDDISMLRVMSSPVFNFNNDEIIFLKNKIDKNKKLFEIILQANQFDIPDIIKYKIEKIISYINYGLKISKQKVIHELFYSILDYTKYDLYIRTLPRFEYYKNLDSIEKIKMIINLYMRNEVFPTLNGFLKYFDEIQGDGFSNFNDIDLENIEEVALMSIHQSKGLEFPVVFISGLSPNKINRYAKLHFDLDKGLIINRPELKTDQDYVKYLKPILDEESFLEEERIFYVAVTRAKNKLILSGYNNKKGAINRFLDKILVEGDDVYKIREEFNDYVCLKEYDLESFKNAKIDTVCSKKNIASGEISEGKFYNSSEYKEIRKNKQIYSVSSLECFAGSKKEYYLKYILGLPDIIKENLDIDPAVFGNTVHAFLEIYYREKFDKNNSRAIFENILNSMGGNFSNLVEEKFNILYENIEKEKKDKILYLEKSFVLPIDKYFIRGTIDRIDLINNKTVSIIDYKTGSKPNQEKYSLSMNIYAYAVEHIFDYKIENINIYYPLIKEKNIFSVNKEKNIYEKIKNLIDEINNTDWNENSKS